MVARLVEAQSLGADVVKLAVMPQSREDVLNLMLASVRYNDLPDSTHAVTISMSGDGLITRLAASFSHSVITFCAGKGVSAPGQVPADDMRGPMTLLAQHLR
jgi:3-dehydroquinate dehydratase I